MNDYSQQTLDRIAQNDKTLTSLVISPYGSLLVDASRKAIGYFDSTNTTTHFYKLSLAIAANTNLTDLKVHDNIIQRRSGESIGPNRNFYVGLAHNSSIRRLEIHDGVERRIGLRGIGYEILKVYQGNKQLTSLRISNSNLQNGVPIAIANTVRLCANLQRLELSSCHITNEQLLPIVESIREHSSIQDLNFFQNRIGNDGCESLATLFEDPNSNIITIQLQDNGIGNEGAFILANSLINNTKLRDLYFDGNPITLSSVEEVFCRVLCNTSSISSIYSSNHTLDDLRLDLQQHKPLNRLLQLNEGIDKSHVAMLKILRYHPDIDMKPLFGWGSEEEGEWTLKGLPYMINWFNRATVAVNERGHRRKDRYKVDQKRLSAVYQFAQAMPLLFAAATPFVIASHAEDESTTKSLVEMESMNKVATDNCCVIL